MLDTSQQGRCPPVRETDQGCPVIATAYCPQSFQLSDRAMAVCLSVWAEEMKLGVWRSRGGHQGGELQKLAPGMCMWGEPECGERIPRRKEQRHNQKGSQGPGPGRVASSQNHWVGNEEEKGSSSKRCSGPAKQRLKANAKRPKCLQ